MTRRIRKVHHQNHIMPRKKKQKHSTNNWLIKTRPTNHHITTLLFKKKERGQNCKYNFCGDSGVAIVIPIQEKSFMFIFMLRFFTKKDWYTACTTVHQREWWWWWLLDCSRRNMACCCCSTSSSSGYRSRISFKENHQKVQGFIKVVSGVHVQNYVHALIMQI